jgi:hypothetical protein
MNKSDFDDPIKLTSSQMHLELRELVQQERIPESLVNPIFDLVNSYTTGSNPDSFRPSLLQELKKRLSGGIVLSDSAREMHFDVMVFIPDNPEKHRCFLRLIPHHPGGRLRYLSEVVT